MATGTIKRPLNDTVEFVNASIGNVTGETVLQKLQRSVSGGYIPLSKPFIGCFLSGAVYFCTGYVYKTGNALYGFYMAGNYNGVYIYKISNDTWSVAL